MLVFIFTLYIKVKIVKKHSIGLVSIIFGLNLFFSGIAGATEGLGHELKKVFEKHIVAMDKENNEAVIKSLHSQSPALMQISQMMQQMFPVFDVKSEILNFRFIALDGDYAITRVEQKMVKVSGPLFQDNITNTIYIFKKEFGEWKLWQAAALDIKFL